MYQTQTSDNPNRIIRNYTRIFPDAGWHEVRDVAGEPPLPAIPPDQPTLYRFDVDAYDGRTQHHSQRVGYWQATGIVRLLPDGTIDHDPAEPWRAAVTPEAWQIQVQYNRTESRIRVYAKVEAGVTVLVRCTQEPTRL